MATPRIETIGNATLMLGDCTEITFGIGPVDLLLTDPPYTSPVAVAFGRHADRSYGNLSIQRAYMKMLVLEWSRLQAKRLFVFCDDDYYPVLHQIFYEAWPFRQMVVWDKGRIGLGRCFRRQHELIIHAAPESPPDLNVWDNVTSHASVLRFAPTAVSDKEHGAQKPLPLIEYLILAGSNVGNAIFDPFMGSGTTGVACARLGRKFVGIEIHEPYFDIACRRIEQAQRQADLFVEPACTEPTKPSDLFAEAGP